MRLHLVVVDVNYHWATRNHGVRYVWSFLKDASPYCTPMSCGRVEGTQTFCNERFAFGYARDNSTYPLFLLHPVREQGDTFTLISVRGGEAFLLNAIPEIRILPLEHFYDAFFFALCCLGEIPRPSVSYTKVISKVAWTGHNLQFTKTN